MNVTIRLIGVFRMNRFDEAVREYPAGTRVRDVIEELRIPPDLFGSVLINDIHADVEDLLRDGDTVCVLPFMDGG